MSRGDAAFLQLESQIWRMLFEIALGEPTKAALEHFFTQLDKSAPQTRLVIPLSSTTSSMGGRSSDVAFSILLL
jgi:hypothetical protein